MKFRTFGLFRHYFRDVKPWSRLMKKDSTGWKTYNREWLPNKGRQCKPNVI
jgi:hypothetical protein